MKDWKTTLAGILLAALDIVRAGGLDGATPKEWAFAFGIAVLGYLAKDS